MFIYLLVWDGAAIARRRRGYVGGEMEGVGLLAASKKSEPVWAIVKGISDFADDQRHDEIEVNRPEACLNAVRFVLAALQRADKELTA